MNMKRKKIFLIAFFLGLLFPSFSFAVGLDLINAKTNPKTPGENQDVTVTLDSFTTDLNSSEIIWYLDKDPIKQGVGEKSIVVRTGEFGKTLNLSVVIISNYGIKKEKSISITPAEIDTLWEAQTYTPPFYKGKALPTFKSLIKVTAIPRYGKASSDPRMFNYTWKYNRTLTVGQGLGRNSALVKMGYADTPLPVSVDVSLPGTDWSGQRSDNIIGTEAKVRFYEQAPLLGINFNRQLPKKITGQGNQFTIKAVPYYFSNEDFGNESIMYTWRVNNVTAVPGLDPTILTLSKVGTDDEQRNAQDFTAALKIQTISHILQEGEARTTVTLPEEMPQ